MFNLPDECVCRKKHEFIISASDTLVGDVIVSLDFIESNIIVDIGFEQIAIGINYCPLCGRKIKRGVKTK